MGNLLVRTSNMFRLIREKGLPGLWERILRWAWRTRHYVALYKILEGNITTKENNMISFRIATEKDIPWICKNMSQLGENAEKIIRQQFEGEDLTLIGTSIENPELIAFSVWLSHKDPAFPLLGEAVSDDEVSVRRVWVPPAMRKKGLATLGMEYFDYAASQIGVKKIWSFIETNNNGSILLHEKLNYITYANVIIKKRFGCSSAVVTTRGDNKAVAIPLPPDRVKL